MAAIETKDLRKTYGRIEALKVIHEARAKREVLTGLLYINPEMRDLNTRESLPAKPLRDYAEEDLRPSRDAFEALIGEYA